MKLAMFVLLSLALSNVCVEAVKPFVIRPILNATTEAAIIIAPAGNVSGMAYQPLAQHMQQISTLKLWVVLLTDFVANLPNPPEMMVGVSEAVSALKEQGMASSNVFLAGHGWGGQLAAAYGLDHARQLSGVLLLGAFLKHYLGGLSTYPVPLLHLSGDLDGQMRITRIAETFQQLQQAASQNQSEIYRKPVNVIRGVSHTQFASGPMPSEIVYIDLKPEVTPETAYKLIANQTAAFLVTSLAVPGPDLEKARKVLDAAYEETKETMEPLLTLKAYDDNPDHSDVWATSAQVQMARVSNYSLRVTNQIIAAEADFIPTQPSIEPSGEGTPLVRTFSHVRYVPNPDDKATFVSAPEHVATKMMSFSAIHNVTHLTPDSDVNITCKDINEVALQVARAHASQLANQRYSSRGRELVFKDDWYTPTDLEWLASQINLFENDVSLNVTSPALWTALNVTAPLPPGERPGLHYCKLLAPYRVAEWMYVDSLRPHPINADSYL